MNNKKKLKEGEEPQRVAQGLPQTKEKEQSPIGEKFIKYLEDIGLKHAAYTNEEGDVKVIGLNKDQVKEAINNMVVKSELKKFVESGLEESEEGEKIQRANDRINKLRIKMAQTKSQNAKNVLQTRLKNALQSLADKKKSMSIKAPHTEIALPAGTGLNLPGGSINGAPTAKDVAKKRAELGRDEATDREDAILLALNDIVKNHSALKLKDQKTGQTMLVDVQSANAVLHIYNGLSDVNKANMLKMGLRKMIEISYKILSKYK